MEIKKDLSKFELFTDASYRYGWLIVLMRNTSFFHTLGLIDLSWWRGYLELMAEFDATNGLLSVKNNRNHLGPPTVPEAPDIHTHTLF